ncbi:hypothetical protein ASD04_12720 [Devosia sp. Root436]|jgi:SAM-dependent methyltransferase|uniref:class I SAM-dependent methyltransferase n=1 Tax=Devosia sp. Root436 TaxID=1736537 RepID=UPI0006FA01E8|nr:class I SAM-dependent methyltransferase [Devosia sp. Root436]KQX35648.1 hypothetical protein ASD04_12720 [Devosia sp. Root436]
MNQPDPDWTQFTHRSDVRYRQALAGEQTEELVRHNIRSGGDRELRMMMDVASLYFDDVPSRGRALDVCCGAGYMTDCLRQFGFDTLGCDLNADAIALAQRHFPANSYIVGDASRPASFAAPDSFDLILAREAHPMSRINDAAIQDEMMDGYIASLKPGGIMIIAHAQTGGGMDYPSIDFRRAAARLQGVTAVGPFMPHLVKRVPPWLRTTAAVPLLSMAARLYQRLTNNRLIEVFYLRKQP